MIDFVEPSLLGGNGLVGESRAGVLHAHRPLSFAVSARWLPKLPPPFFGDKVLFLMNELNDLYSYETQLRMWELRKQYFERLNLQEELKRLESLKPKA